MNKTIQTCAVSENNTIGDLAKLAGVSVSTVIKVLTAADKKHTPGTVTMTQTTPLKNVSRLALRAFGIAHNPKIVFKKAKKTVSKNPKGLTLRQLEDEIYKIERIRVVFRTTNDSLRSGTSLYGQALSSEATIADLGMRIQRYFNRLTDVSVVKGITFVVIGPDGRSHHSTRSAKRPLSSLRFITK